MVRETVFFERVTPLLWRGWRRPLAEDDVPGLRGGYGADALASAVEARLPRSGVTLGAVVRAMMSAFGQTYCVGMVLIVVGNLCKMFTPVVLCQIVRELCKPGDRCWWWALVLFALLMANTACVNSYIYRVMTTGLRANVALSGAMYRKALRLSAASRAEYSAGRITNLAGGDTFRVEMACWFANDIWSATLNVALTLCVLFFYLRWYALVGAAFMVLVLPALSFLSTVRAGYTEARAHVTDARVSLLQDMVSGMRVVKLYAWEGRFRARVAETRRKELLLVRSWKYVGALSDVVVALGTSLAILATFTTAALCGRTFSPDVVFASMALFGCMAWPLRCIPMAAGLTRDGVVSLRRIAEFLSAAELEPVAAGAGAAVLSSAPAVLEPGSEVVVADLKSSNGSIPTAELASSAEIADVSVHGSTTDGEKAESPLSQLQATASDAIPRRGGRVSIANASFRWKGEGEDVLKNVTLAVSPGQLVAVVGPVGAGKSSLLCAILGEMQRTAGSVSRSGSLSYCAQHAWLAQGTVRDNILFGRAHDAARLASVIDACCLRADLEALPGGDLAQVGERGCTLSGGQKQRVSLARALYADASLVLLDDPLSALDAAVGRQIFARVISGAMAGATRVLVTHRHDLLRHADTVVVMQGGAISHVGAYSSLVAAGVKFTSLGVETADQSDGSDAEAESAPPSPAVSATPSAVAPGEEKTVGTVDGRVYWDYFRCAGGLSFVFVVVSSVFLMNLAGYGATYYLGTAQADLAAGGWALAKYMGICVVQVAFATLFALVLAVGTLRAGRLAFERALAGVLRAPMSFFDATPAGRIVDRLSKDVDVLDSQIGDTLGSVLATASQTLATLCVLVAVSRPLIVAATLVLVLYALMKSFYARTGRELKRVETRLRAPFLAHAGEMLSGAATLRAYGVCAESVGRSASLRDAVTCAAHAQIEVQRWLFFRMEALNNTVVLLAAAYCFYAPVEAGLAGLQLNGLLGVMGVMNWCVRQLTELETQIVSAERLAHYRERLPREAPSTLPTDGSLCDWPSGGAVVFRDVAMRYRPDLPLVLSGLSFSVRPGERVGIVGRTGAGKSSIMLALFRMVELDAGAILVDGVDIAGMGLSCLRGALSIIPQDPVLFGASVRFNLDPAGVFGDAELFDALSRAHLREAVARLPGGLDADVGESTFSAGQKQLFCLARAILKKSRVLVLDEATANVDPETDALVQAAVASEFAGRTVLTIAHRLATVLDYDRVLVLDAGRVREYDAPRVLAAQRGSAFAALLRDSSH